MDIRSANPETLDPRLHCQLVWPSVRATGFRLSPKFAPHISENVHDNTDSYSVEIRSWNRETEKWKRRDEKKEYWVTYRFTTPAVITLIRSAFHFPKARNARTLILVTSCSVFSVYDTCWLLPLVSSQAR